MIVQGIRSNKFLPRAIQFWMVIYRLRINTYRYFTSQPLLERKRIPNHFSLLNNEDEYEAIGEGVVKVPIDLEHHQWIKHWYVPSKDMSLVLDPLVGKGYEFLNFITNMVYALTGIWIGDFLGRWYCVELVNYALIENGDKNVKKHWNPLQTAEYLDKHYGGVVIKDDEILSFKKLESLT